MKCRKCGWEMTEQARFCPNCGAPVELAESAESPDEMSLKVPDIDNNSVPDMNQNNRKKGKNKKRNKLLIVLLILCALVLAAIIGVLLYTGTDSDQISRKLSLGDRYLEEKDYERAVAAYDEAVEIDPKSVDAYLGLAAAHSEYAQDLIQKAEDAQENEDAENYALYIMQARTEAAYSEESRSTVEILVQEQESELSDDKRQAVEEKADSVQKQNEETNEKMAAMPDSIDPDSGTEEDVAAGEKADKGPMYQAYLEVLEDRETEILLYEDWVDISYDSYPAYPAMRREIAFYDLDGDGMEELIFVDGERNSEDDYGQGYLYIYTYRDGEAVEVYRNIARTNAGGGSTFTIATQNDSDSFMIINSYADEFVYVYVRYCSMKDGAVSVDSWRMIGIDYLYNTYGDGEPYGLAGEGEGDIDEFSEVGMQASEQQVSLDTVEQNRQEIQAQIAQVLLRDYQYDSSESVYDGYIRLSGEPDNPMNLEEAKAYLQNLIGQYGGSGLETEEETSGVSDSEWKQAYLEHAREYESAAGDSAEYVSYKLFNLNGDEIPELLIVGISTAAGMEICTYEGGEVYSTTISMGALYCHPGSGLCLNRQVRMGGEVDFIYNKVGDGGFAVLAEGSGIVVEGETNYDNPALSDCLWNGESVSYEQYRENLEDLVPLEGAQEVEKDSYDLATLVEELE